MDQITIVGGGLAGLIAAIECAEAGAPTRLLEARRRLGGRATSSPGPFVANLGPHALYTGTALWDWLDSRGLAQPCGVPKTTGGRFRVGGRVRRMPPRAVMRAWRLRHIDAPVDLDLHTWLSEGWGDRDARVMASVAGVLTFDHDPGRLSAAFVWERARRILLQPRVAARYVVGGWQALVDRLADAARARGVQVETGARVDDLGELRGGPVVVAVEPGAARRLLGDDGLRVESPRVALVDVGLTSRRGDLYVVLDGDEAMFLTRPSAVVPSLAPEGQEVVQVSAPLRPDEDLEAGVARAERLLDGAFRDWREREVWRRRSVVGESTGALDLPGATWRDRPPVDYGDGLWLAGDWVASPGHLSEVSCTSAVEAAAGAVRALRSTRSGVS